MAMHDRNPILRRSREDAPSEATLAPVARLLPTPHPRTESGLPKRYVGRHRLSGDTRERRGQHTVDELLAKIQRTAAETQAKQHITDVQDQLDAEDVAS